MKKRINLLIALSLSIASTFNSCSKDEDEDNNKDQQTVIIHDTIYQRDTVTIEPVIDTINNEQYFTGKIGSYSYVDLGLSVKWATHNVGANSICEHGNLYAWGETVTKDTFSESNYKFANSTKYIIEGERNVSELSEITGNTLLPEDDAATVNWGSSWRMPTKDELTELIEGCNWTWVKNFNGSNINGYLGVSKINGNKILLQADGYGYYSQNFSYQKISMLNRTCEYITSTGWWNYSGRNKTAFGMMYQSEKETDKLSYDNYGPWCYEGCSVRPVIK